MNGVQVFEGTHNFANFTKEAVIRRDVRNRMKLERDLRLDRSASGGGGGGGGSSGNDNNNNDQANTAGGRRRVDSTSSRHVFSVRA